LSLTEAVKGNLLKGEFYLTSKVKSTTFMHNKMRVGIDKIDIGMSKLDPIWKLLNVWLG